MTENKLKTSKPTAFSPRKSKTQGQMCLKSPDLSHGFFIAATKAPIKPTLKAMKTFLLETDRAPIRSSLITFGCYRCAV